MQEAKSLGDLLVVAINSDESISKLKGPNRPINPLEERLAMMASLKAVDMVTFFKEDTPVETLKVLKPDILVKGGDYKSKNEIVGYDIVEAYGGEAILLSETKGKSTTNIIQKILAQET
jgi:D-beta-D-heptose 7-phosphate kinase/D-beta-D-heptose 1-phosphate adenosyltransferase